MKIINVKHALRGDYTTRLLHETKLETALHKFFGEIFGQDLLK